MAYIIHGFMVLLRRYVRTDVAMYQHQHLLPSPAAFVLSIIVLTQCFEFITAVQRNAYKVRFRV